MKSILFFLTTLIFSITQLEAQTFNVAWETDNVLKTPESVWFDEARNQVYVSNINGNPTDKDGNGFIALLKTDGTVKTLKWVVGMNAPKGMVVVGNLLYVTDIDRFHMIDIDKARIIKTVEVDSAQFLNDMAADEDGNIYISDMSRNHLLKYDGKQTSIWLDDELFVSPNGLAFYDGFLYSGTKDNLLKVNVNNKTYDIFIAATGPIDGLVPLGNDQFVISDWSGKISLVSPVKKIVLSNTSQDKIQAADLGFIPSENLILVPTFFDNRVVARKLVD